MKRVRILVCGTNYGRSYLEAINLRPNVYELAGILALGSARSQNVAQQYGVRLYRKVDDLPQGINIACAAMGSAGFEAVLRLLRRGIHVLCEHPQRPEHVQTALQIAAANKICFYINGHFGDLEASRAFVKHCLNVRPSAKPSFLNVMATERSYYGVLDILRRVLETFEPFQFDVISRDPPFIVVQGILGGIRATFQVQCSGGAESSELKDGSREYLIDYRIAVGFPMGILTLMSISGPVIWNSNFNWAADLDSILWGFISSDTTITSEKLHHQRILTNLQAIQSLLRNVRERITPPEQEPRHILEVSQVWESIGIQLHA